MKNKLIPHIFTILFICTMPGCSKDSSMVTVPEGKVIIVNGENIDTKNVNKFLIDKFEVSRKDYKSFVDKTGQGKPKDWKVYGYDVKKSNHPVTYVSYDNARAYCIWLNKDLPSEAQWQLAAAGSENFKYPWGNTFKDGLSNTSTSMLRTTTEVTDYPEGISPYGAFNMAGNVWEWTTTKVGREMIVKGSSWGLSHSLATTQNKSFYVKEATTNNIGFRCVKNL